MHPSVKTSTLHRHKESGQSGTIPKIEFFAIVGVSILFSLFMAWAITKILKIK